MCCVRRGRRRLDSFVFCRDLAVEARGQAEVAKRAGAAKRVARRGADQRAPGQPLAPLNSGRGKAASHEQQKGRRGSPTAVRRARKWGAAALGSPSSRQRPPFCRSLARIVKLTRKCHGLGAAKPRFVGRPA